MAIRFASMASHITTATAKPLVAAAVMAWVAIASPLVAASFQAAEIVVVDSQNKWPAPLVQLRTTHGVVFATDNNGVIAVDAPELLGREVWFHIEGHGYGVKADGFGYRGRRLTLRPGQRTVVEVDRQLPGKRIGRLTGAALFGESQQLGRERDWRESGVFGCDSVQTAVYRNRLFWLWGDTTLPGYPLGIFNVSGATTPLAPREDWRPPLRLGAEYRYFRNKQGAPRGIADISGDGPTWLWGLVALPDENGAERLAACYEKVRSGAKSYETGLCLWNDQRELFERVAKLWTRTDDDERAPVRPTGHAVLHTDANGERWVLFGDPFPHMKCRATLSAWQDPESWTLLQPQREVRVAGEDRAISPHRGAFAFNKSRGRWVAVFTERLGKSSAFGEIWYCEADQPTGPWGPAVQVVTHDNYSFYNPALHPELTPAGSSVLLFEATYTSTFADHAAKTPRHDYNQVLYRLDLDDPQLKPAQGSAE